MNSFECHIGKKRSKPPTCPVCGLSSDYPNVELNYGNMLKSIYTHPNRLVCRDIDGWPGYKTWYFQCDHESPFKQLIYNESPMFNLINKSFDDFRGKSFPLPMAYK